MMAYSEDHIALAAEYAIGTLDANDRARVEAMMAADDDYVQMVNAWVWQLGVLNQMVGSVEPRAEVWDRIKAAVAETAADEAQPQLTLTLTPGDALDMIAAARATSSGPVPEPVVPSPSQIAPGRGGEPAMADIIDFPGQVRRWRSLATATSAIAAALIAFVAVQITRPDLLPPNLRSKPAAQQTAQAPSTAPSSASPSAPAQYVALLQKDGATPAFILTVDGGSRTFTVRKLSATAEPGHSHELWIVSDKLQKPRSLGVIGGHDFTIRPDLASYAPETVNQATYAVTDEPEGGSKTGQPTGPIVFSGKLIETVPQR